MQVKTSFLKHYLVRQLDQQYQGHRKRLVNIKPTIASASQKHHRHINRSKAWFHNLLKEQELFKNNCQMISRLKSVNSSIPKIHSFKSNSMRLLKKYVRVARLKDIANRNDDLSQKLQNTVSVMPFHSLKKFNRQNVLYKTMLSHKLTPWKTRASAKEQKVQYSTIKPLSSYFSVSLRFLELGIKLQNDGQNLVRFDLLIRSATRQGPLTKKTYILEHRQEISQNGKPSKMTRMTGKVKPGMDMRCVRIPSKLFQKIEIEDVFVFEGGYPKLIPEDDLIVELEVVSVHLMKEETKACFSIVEGHNETFTKNKYRAVRVEYKCIINRITH